MQTTDERGRDARGDQTTDGATPQCATSAQSVGAEGAHEVQAARTSEDGHSQSMALPHKKSARGMSVRRRIGLKIEPDETDGHGHTSTNKKRSDDLNDNEKEAQLRPLGLTGEIGGVGSEGAGGGGGGGKGGGEEWWKLEYRAPRPGHLGAHVIAPEDEHKNSPSRARNTSADATTGTATPPTPSSVERSHLHETPERARKVRGGSELYDATTSHSSPNPKRKIMDLQDIEAGSFPSMGVAKELKRFHETNGELPQQHLEGESELARTLRSAVVTPSKLLRSMKKIDIQAGSAPTTTTTTTTTSGAQPLEKNGASAASNAPESA